MKKHNLKSLTRKAMILNENALLKGRPFIIDFDFYIQVGDIDLTSFVVNVDYKIIQSVMYAPKLYNGYKPTTSLEPTQSGMKKLLSKCEAVRKLVNDEWNVFITNEYTALKGGAK